MDKHPLSPRKFNVIEANFKERKLPSSGKNQTKLEQVKNWLKNHKKQVRIGLIGGGVFVLLCLIGTSFWVISQYNAIGDVRERIKPPVQGSSVYDAKDRPMFGYFDQSERREVVDLKNVPDSMKLAVVGLEDENFYKNPVGIPWQNMIGAGFKCVTGGGCRGGSGLSQQLVKNATGDDSANTSRKMRELLTAIKLNQELNQDDILGLYLNYVPFGRNTYGVEQSAKAFFGHGTTEKDSNGNYKLTLPESCYIASMTQRPSTYTNGVEEMLKGNTDDDGWKQLQARKNACLEKMYSQDLQGNGKGRLITSQDELDKLQQEKVTFLPTETAKEPYPHLKNYLIGELSKLGINETDLASKGYQIYTTFDIDVQKEAEQSVNDLTNSSIIANGANNTAVAILDGPSGNIVGMVGSRDFYNDSIQGQVNIATSPRQPGSSFKPYVYTSAFENGFNPGTILLDAPTDFGNYKPQNLSKQNYGLKSIRYSLQNSLNVPAVKGVYLNQNPNENTPDGLSGINKVFQLADSVGVKTPLKTDNNCGVSSALGTCEVTPLSHAAGINALLQEGKYSTPNPFRKVIIRQQDIFSNVSTERDLFAEAQNGSNPLYVKAKQVVDVLNARQIENIMSDYLSRDPAIWGNARKLLELDGWTGANSVAAKTGTTSDVKDTWTVGGTPYYTVVVWVGNTDNKPLKNTSGAINAAAPIWKDIMTKIHKDLPKKGFSQEGLLKVQLDPNTGLPVTTGGITELLTATQKKNLDDAVTLLNKPDYDPTKNSIFQNRTPVVTRKLKISKIDGKLVTDGQLPDQLVDEITCSQVVSEFPLAANWFGPAQDYQKSRASDFKACPTEIATNDPNAQKPQITANISDNQNASEQTIDVDIKTIASSVSVNSITLKIDGSTVKSEVNKSSLSYDWKNAGISGTKNVVIETTDSLNQTNQLTINNVEFNVSKIGTSNLTNSDIPSLVVSCDPIIAGLPTNCQITIPPKKTIPATVKIFIGSNSSGASCNTSTGKCTLVPTNGNSAGQADIKISLTGTSATAIATSSKATLN